VSHLVAVIALDGFNRRRFLPNFLFFLANGGTRSFALSDGGGKCNAIITRSNNLEEVLAGVLLPIKEQVIRICDGLQPLIGLLCKITFKVLQEPAVSFTVSSENESTSQVLLLGVLFGCSQCSWGCCSPGHWSARSGKRSVNQSAVIPRSPPQCSMTSTLFWNFSRYA
jgi:hypothetical protein